MFTLRHTRHTLGWDLVWWFALLTLAGTLAVVLTAQTVKGAAPAAPADPPRLMPTIAEPWFDGIVGFREGDYEAARDAFRRLEVETRHGGGVGAVDPAAALWRVLADQAAGDWEAAIVGWTTVRLPPEHEVWRHLGRTAAWLEMNDLDRAIEMLGQARATAPEHPLVRYYAALVRLTEAEEGRDWYDAVGPTTLQLAGYTAPTMMPNTRTNFQRAAMAELEAALERAGELDVTAPLVPTTWTAAPNLAPTVADAMLALGVEAFEANAHQMLGYLLIEHHEAERAETHLDAATVLGARTPYGYEDLGGIYEREGRHFDAARAFAKQVREGTDKAGATVRMFENLRAGFREGWLP